MYHVTALLYHYQKSSLETLGTAFLLLEMSEV